jgi:hypothetical protein
VLITKSSADACKITGKICAGQGAFKEKCVDGIINAGRSAAMAGVAIGIE